MKLPKLLFNLLLLMCFFSFSQCKKTKTNPIGELPPETQTGANTFGCLVDGKAFTPGGSSLSGPNKGAVYQYLIPGTPNGYTFAVSGTDKRNPENISIVGFGFDSVRITTGNYVFKTRKNGQGGAGYRKIEANYPNGNLFNTNETVSGELLIKKFDTIHQIVSGTFWFNAINSSNEKVEIREGRFDMRYTR